MFLTFFKQWEPVTDWEKERIVMRKKKKKSERFNWMCAPMFSNTKWYLSLPSKKGIRELEKWEGYINQMVVKYDIPDDRKLVEAIILTETKGQHIDIMQSSESQTGNPNTIFSSEESIESGVKHLADVIHYGEQKEVDKWTSVQGL